jgi:hypothetical protein
MQTHFKEDDPQNKSLHHINDMKLTTSWSDLFSTIPVTHLFSTIPKLQLPPPPADATTPATDKTFEVKLDDNEDELFETPSADNLPFRIGLPHHLRVLATDQVLEAELLLLAEPPRPENLLQNKFGFDIQSTLPTTTFSTKQTNCYPPTSRIIILDVNYHPRMLEPAYSAPQLLRTPEHTTSPARCSLLAETPLQGPKWVPIISNASTRLSK